MASKVRSMGGVNSISEWKKLPEVLVPQMESETQTGTIENVVKVGFLGVSVSDCSEAGITTRPLLGERCVLPTAVVARHGNTELSRLPLDLAPWVVECVALAQGGRNPFPSRVEFGKIDGRVYAQFILDKSELH